MDLRTYFLYNFCVSILLLIYHEKIIYFNPFFLFFKLFYLILITHNYKHIHLF
jgi:hypothetical protein